MNDISRIFAELCRIAEGKDSNPDPAVEGHNPDSVNRAAINAEADSEKMVTEEDPIDPNLFSDYGSPADTDTEGEDKDSDEVEITSADMIKALEGTKQGIEKVKAELGYAPDSALLRSLQEVFAAVQSMQEAVVEDAKRNPEAEVPATTITQPEEHLIGERDTKAE